MATATELPSSDRHHKKVLKHARQLLEDAGIHDVWRVFTVDTDCPFGDEIAYVNRAKQARTARFRKGASGPVLDGVSHGWPVTQVAKYRVVITLHADDEIPVLTWVVTRLVDAISESPVPITVHLEREDDDG